MRVSMNDTTATKASSPMRTSNPCETADAARAGAAGLTSNARKTLLCVDDEPAILSALKRTLRSPEIVVVTATSGAQALEIMAELRIDLVISDMRMPGMDGAQLLEHVCRDWPDTVRMLLTGYSDATDTIRAVNRGQIFRHLQKPWGERELLESVREGLALRSRLQDEARLLGMSATQATPLRQLNV